MTERPNKELADRYWSDQTLKAWYWSALDKCWVVVNNPWFGDDKDWHVGHEAPKEQPQKMCELAGVKFPMPMAEKPKDGSTFWVATVGGVYVYDWNGWTSDVHALAARICHTTEAAAQAHHLALDAANQQAIEGAK